MKKRIFAIALSILITLSMFPSAIWAVDSSDGQQQSIYSTSRYTYDDTWDPDYLNELEHSLYDSIRSVIEERARTGGEMIITLNLQGMSFDNGGETDQDQLRSLGLAYFENQVRLDRVLSCLLISMPYEMFWYDKMSSAQMGIGISTTGNTTEITAVSFYLPVYETYQDQNSEQKQYTLSSTAAEEAAAKVANAQKIVDENAGKSDMEKLAAYKEAICNLVSYDEEALEILNNPSHPDYATFYGEPFQITNVFDGDPDTNVVCEGYARAFQYLCDLSDFDDVECYSVVGTMTVLQGQSEIPGAGHMWNIVKIDGKSYMVDVTNCDEGTIGDPDFFFMKEPASGSVDGGYVFDGKDNSQVKYTYAAQYTTDGFYYDSILNLTGKYMTGSVSISGTPKIGETLTANTEGTPKNANLTYQWYRDDQAVSGAVGSTYTPDSADDVGKTLKVTVSASGYEGSLSAQTSGQVSKAEAVAVNPIELLAVTKDSITIETNPGEEYACVIFTSSPDSQFPSEDQWQDSGEFTGLTSGNYYVVYARCKETPTHNATPVEDYEYKVVLIQNTISSVEAYLSAPVKYQDLPSPATSTDNITVTVKWYEDSVDSGIEATGKAKPDQIYEAQVTFSANTGYSFAAGCVISMNGQKLELPSSTASFNLKVKFNPTEAKALTSISVTQNPDKATYNVGEKFDPTGMEITAYYDDGSQQPVPIEDCNFTPEEMALDTESVTVSYGGKTTDVKVTVIPPKAFVRIEVTKNPDKTTYVVGESFDPTGMEITAYYDDDSKEQLSIGDCTFTPEKMMLDTKSVTVSYGEKTDTIAVTVSEKPIASDGAINVTQPEKYIKLAEFFTWAGQPQPEGITETDFAWYKGDNTTGEHVSGMAEPSQIYTAKITLKAGEDYIFTQGFSIKVNDENVTAVLSDDGKTAVLTITFPATEDALESEMIPIDEAIFPDEVFREYVKRYDTNGDGYLHIEERESVEWIFLVSSGIEDLKGIEYFPNLKTLQCYSNNLTELDVSKLSQLTYLDCRSNNLTELDVSKLSQLTYLDCSYNNLTELNVLQASQLTDLGCSYNNLTELDLSACPDLESISCSENRLTNIYLTGMPNLKKFSCNSNQLADLDLSKMPKLEKLTVYNNPLTELDLSGLPELKELSCLQCQFTELDLSKNVNIERVACQYNQLTALNLSNCSNLLQLHCDINQLTEVDISQCPEIEIFSCSGNQLAFLDISHNPKLNQLGVDMQTREQNVDRNADGLWRLDLSGLVDDGDKVKNIKLENADLDEEGKTVVFSDGLSNSVVTYDYYVTDEISFPVSITLVPMGIHTDAGLASVTVSDMAGEVSGTEITVKLPYGSILPTDMDQVNIVPSDDFASVSDLICGKDGAEWTFTIIAEDGVTKEDYTVLVSVAPCTHDYEDGKCVICGEIDPDYEPVIMAGANSIWQKGEKEGLAFVSSAAFRDFLKVQVDGNDVAMENYDVKEGSTAVTLKASYLETLSVGSHSIAVVSQTGTAETKFTVKATEHAAKDEENPKTGESSDITLWAALMLAAALGFGRTAVWSRRKKYSK